VQVAIQALKKVENTDFKLKLISRYEVQN